MVPVDEPIYDGNGLEIEIGDRVEWSSIVDPIEGEVIGMREHVDGTYQVRVAWDNGNNTWCSPSYVAA